MKTMAKITIRNANKSQLLSFIAELDQDWPDTLTLIELRKRAKQCENNSKRWFVGKVTFEEWANN